jgi:Uma2 family endonuclease
MSTQPHPYVSPQEYLRREREAPYKSEYFQGVIYPMGNFDGDTPEAMAGATTNHNRIKRNLEFALTAHFRKRGGCEAFSGDQRIFVPENGLYTYPDVLAVCGRIVPAEADRHSITNPNVIVEVLSKRTAAYDRGEKFRLYRGIPTLDEYLLVDSRKVDVVLYRKAENGLWTLVQQASQFSETVTLESLGVALPLEELYLDTNLTYSLYLLREP